MTYIEFKQKYAIFIDILKLFLILFILSSVSGLYDEIKDLKNEKKSVVIEETKKIPLYTIEKGTKLSSLEEIINSSGQGEIVYIDITEEKIKNISFNSTLKNVSLNQIEEYIYAQSNVHLFPQGPGGDGVKRFLAGYSE